MKLLLTLLAVIGLLQEERAPAQLAPTAQSVIENYITAKGGKSALEKVENVTIKGQVISGNETVGEFEIYQAPSRHLTIERFPGGLVRSHGTNGKIAWRIGVDGKAVVLAGQEARDYIRHYETLHESLEWSKQSKAIRYVGIKTVDETPVHHLIFVGGDNRQINRYFDVETGLFVREEQIVGEDGETEILISQIRNYVRDNAGTMVSRSRVNHFGSDYSVEYKITSVDSNQISDAKVFAVPPIVIELQRDSQNDN